MFIPTHPLSILLPNPSLSLRSLGLTFLACLQYDVLFPASASRPWRRPHSPSRDPLRDGAENEMFFAHIVMYIFVNEACSESRVRHG